MTDRQLALDVDVEADPAGTVRGQLTDLPGETWEDIFDTPGPHDKDDE